jgi:hypothetical protein
MTNPKLVLSVRLAAAALALDLTNLIETDWRGGSYSVLHRNTSSGVRHKHNCAGNGSLHYIMEAEVVSNRGIIGCNWRHRYDSRSDSFGKCEL